MLDLMNTGGEWGGEGLHRSDTEMTADSSRERNGFKRLTATRRLVHVAKSDWFT